MGEKAQERQVSPKTSLPQENAEICSVKFRPVGVGVQIGRLQVPNSGEFQVTVCGVTACPFSRHKGNPRSKCQKKASNASVMNCPFSNKTNLHLELPGENGWGKYSHRIRIRKMSETATTTTSQKSIAIRLQFVLQYAPNLYCNTPGAPTL